MHLGSAALLERFINTFRTHHEKELVGGYSGSEQGGSILHFNTKAFTDEAYVSWFSCATTTSSK